MNAGRFYERFWGVREVGSGAGRMSGAAFRLEFRRLLRSRVFTTLARRRREEAAGGAPPVRRGGGRR